MQANKMRAKSRKHVATNTHHYAARTPHGARFSNIQPEASDLVWKVEIGWWMWDTPHCCEDATNDNEGAPAGRALVVEIPVGACNSSPKTENIRDDS